MIIFQKPFPGAARTELESQLQRAVKVSAKGKRVKCKMDLERCLFWDPAGNRVPAPELREAQEDPGSFGSWGRTRRALATPGTELAASGTEAAHAAFSLTKCHCGLGSYVAVPGTELAASELAKSGPRNLPSVARIWLLPYRALGAGTEQEAVPGQKWPRCQKSKVAWPLINSLCGVR